MMLSISNIKSYESTIDDKDINKIEELIKSENNNENDIIFEMYNSSSLTPERLQFLMEKCSKYYNKHFNVSSALIKRLIKDNQVSLLDIIFSHIKIYDTEFILKLLLCYKNKIAISIVDLKAQISDCKYKISSYTGETGSGKYLFYECFKDNSILKVKYLVEHGADVNKENRNGETPLFSACIKGNEAIVKYLMEHGADIHKEY